MVSYRKGGGGAFSLTHSDLTPPLAVRSQQHGERRHGGLPQPRTKAKVITPREPRLYATERK